MMKRGAVVEVVLPRGPHVSHDVKAAHQAALAAARDCQRRVDARAGRQEQKTQAQQRKATFRAWAETGDTASYRAWLAKAGEHWNAMQDRVADDPVSREQMHIRRGSAFKRYRKEWESILSEAGRRDRHAGILHIQKDRLDLIADRIHISLEQQQLTLSRRE